MDYRETGWREFVARARDRVDGGSLGAAVSAAATNEQLSDHERAQLAFYLSTEIADDYAADADELSATTFDEGKYPVATRSSSPAATTPCRSCSPTACRSCSTRR